MSLLGRLWHFLVQCTCAHHRAQLLELHHKGVGVAELRCPDCGHRSTWEFEYDKPDDEK